MSEIGLPRFLCFALMVSLVPAQFCLGMTTNHENHAAKEQDYFVVRSEVSILGAPDKPAINLNYTPAKMQFSYNELDSRQRFYDNPGTDLTETKHYLPALNRMRDAAVEGAWLGLILGKVISVVASGHPHSSSRSAWIGAAAAATASGVSSFFEQTP